MLKKKVNAKTTARLEEILRRGHSLEKQQLHEAAIAEYRKVLDVDPKNLAASQLLGMLYHRLGENRLAAPLLARVVKALPSKADLQCAYGAVLSAIGDHEASSLYYRKALALSPNYQTAHFNLSQEMVFLGQTEAAIEGLRKVLELNPGFAPAHQQLAQLGKYTEYDDHIRTMEQLYEQATDAGDKKALAFGLASAHRQLGNFDQSFEYLATANRYHRKTLDYSPKYTEKLFSNLQRAFPAELFATESSPVDSEFTPIFIVGMPRSGTTLIEQILASHSAVHGAGELQNLGWLCKGLLRANADWTDSITGVDAQRRAELARQYIAELRQLAGDKVFLTDKMPQNFQYLGLIALLFPNARIIHCQRDPLDTCLSIFSHLFKGAHFYAYDLEELGDYYLRYQEMMTYWERLLPGRIYPVQYERMVDDTETEVRALLDYCGLPFEAACLSFFETKRTITTVSATQVRQPIYTSSVESWRHFEKGLEPLRRVLGL